MIPERLLSLGFFNPANGQLREMINLDSYGGHEYD
jgi:hypothetical protein